MLNLFPSTLLLPSKVVLLCRVSSRCSPLVGSWNNSSDFVWPRPGQRHIEAAYFRPSLSLTGLFFAPFSSFSGQDGALDAVTFRYSTATAVVAVK